MVLAHQLLQVLRLGQAVPFSPAQMGPVAREAPVVPVHLSDRQSIRPVVREALRPLKEPERVRVVG